MRKIVPPDQERARQIIREWLTTQTRSLRNLAQEAGIQPSVLSRFLHGTTTLEASSALKLYGVMQQSLHPFDRKSFIETTGLLPLATAFGHDALFAIDLNTPPYETGSRLMVTGIELYGHAAYEAAIPLFRTAQEVLGSGSSQAAFAGCMIAQIFINLGDLLQAQAEARQVQNSYAAVMDLETKADLYRILNWIDYYQGDYVQAEQWLRKRIMLGEEAGIERFQNAHFLGRTYYDLGCLCPGTKESVQLFHRAAACFERSYQIHLQWGNEHNKAFDHFRKAQVLQMQGYSHDAQKRRVQARQMFSDGSVGGAMALLNIEQEEAKLLLEEGSLKQAKRKAEQALSGWSHFKYAKGVGDSLKILGELAYMQGKADCALEILTARLCIYPYDHHPSNQQVWEDVNALNQETIRREGRKFHQAVIQQLHTTATQRQGYFAYLDQIIADRSLALIRIMGSLQAASS